MKHEKANNISPSLGQDGPLPDLTKTAGDLMNPTPTSIFRSNGSSMPNSNVLNKNNSDEYKFQCVKDDQIYENLKFQWKLNEEILKNEESDIISVDYTNLFEDDNIRLECLASNQAGTSWAFLDWSNATESWR